MARLNWGKRFNGFSARAQHSDDSPTDGNRNSNRFPPEASKAHSEHGYWLREAKRRRRNGRDWVEAEKRAEDAIEIFRQIMSIARPK